MEQRHLGRSGLRVSRLGLGTAGWGRQVDQHEAGEQLRAYLDAGGTFIDTADVYGHGESERVIGTLLREVVDREEIVLATKAGLTDQGSDASRRHLLRALDQSLHRLGTDHVDVWHLHNWDQRTPIEETLSACDAAVASGRARYVAASNYVGWQAATASAWQRAAAGARAELVANQVEYSLLRRDAEREVLPAAEALGFGVVAWGPLGRGVLSGKYRGGGVPTESRAATPGFEAYVRPYLSDEHGRVVNSVVTAAEGLDATPLQVALAWVRDRFGVAAAVVGARTTQQLRASLSAEELSLPDEIRKALDDVSAFTT